MATEKLTVEMYLKNKGYIKNVNRATQANKRMQKSSGGASAAIIELGRGASDARFGFHGLGNNLERSTELIGSLIKKSGGLKGAFKELSKALLGPAGIVLGITILIAYGPAIINFFKGIVGASTEASDALEKFYEDQEKAKLTTQDKEIQKINDAIAEKISALEKLGRREANLARQQKTLSEAELLRRKAINAEIDLLQNKISSMQNKAKVEELMAKSKKEQAKASAAIALKVSDTKKLLTAQGESEDYILKSELAILQAADLSVLAYKDQLKYLKDIQVIKAQIATNDRIAGREFASNGNKILGDNKTQNVKASGVQGLTLNKNLKGNTRGIEHLSPDQVGKGLKKLQQDNKKVVESFDTVGYAASAASSLVGAFTASLLGPDSTALERAGVAIIGTLASIAIAAAVAGASESAAATGPAAIFTLPTFIALGLAAVAAALSGTGARTGSGGGGSRATPSSTTISPNSVQGAGGDGSLVATVRGQDLRFVLQAADDSYGALS